MALFSNINNQYYDESDRSLLSKMEDFYQNSVSLNQQFWAEADLDTRFYSGDQTVWNDVYGSQAAFNRKQFSFNRIRRIIEMPSGYQRKNRKSTLVVPVENSDQQTADQLSKIMSWANRNENISETISDAFSGALITGMNLLQVWMDYREDPVSGNIKVDNCSYNSFVIDPFFRKTDLSDCNAIWKRSYITMKQAKSLLPDKTEEIDGCISMQAGSRDGKFQYMPENFNYESKGLLAYDEFYYRDYRTQKMLIDTETGESLEWKGDDDKLRDYLRMYPQVTIVEQDIPTVKLGIVLQGKVMYDGPNPIGIDEYPFVPVIGYYTPDMPYYQYRIQGMVRGLRDAQYLYNRRKVIELDILESQVNSGWVAKEGAFVDPKSPYKTGQGQVLWLKKEAQMTDVQQIQASNVSPSMMNMSDQMSREIMEISGVNEELLGSAGDDKAGILSMLRQGAGLTTLQRLFDQLDNSQKLLGKLMIKLVQANFTPGKVQRIIEEQPAESFYNKNFGRYDAAIEEGFDTSTQRQTQFAQMLHLKEVGVPIPTESLLEASTMQNKNKIIEAIKQQEQQQAQAQQAQMQSEMAQQEATMQMAKARAAADIGLAVERESRVQENKQLAVERSAKAAENSASAEKDKAESILNLMKAIKELEGMDIDNLMKAIQIQKQIHQEVQLDQASMNSMAQMNAQPTNMGLQ